jgi:hypothetical protein
MLCTPTKFNNHSISRRFEEQIHKIEITLYCIYFNYNIMNQQDVIEDTISFMVNHEQHCCRSNCNRYSTEYNVKLLNNGKKIIVNISFSFDNYYSSYQSNRQVNKTEKILYDDDIQLSKSQIELLKNIYKPYSNINIQCNNIRCIYTGIHNFLKPEDILNDFCEIVNFLKKNKDVVFTREEFNSLEENAQKELKETENKLKETENKLKETENKLKESDNKLKELDNKLKESDDKFQLLQITHNDLIINNNNLKNNYINDKKEIIKKCKSEITRLNDDVNKKIKELQDKNSRIQSNNLEITIENKKLSRQLEDITELYELLLTKQSDNKLEETEDKLKESNDKLKESENKLTESNNKLTESENELTELNNKLTETENKLTESNDKLKESENELIKLNDKLKESINNTQFYESLLTKQNDKLKESDDKLKELYDKQKNDENSGWGILSLFFQK